MKIKTFYRNRLPHWVPVGATFFVTFRLAGTIPQYIINLLRVQRENNIKAIVEPNALQYQRHMDKIHGAFFKAYDDYLDQNSSKKCYLSSPSVASIVAKKLQEYDGQFYDLQAYCIMPNHVHILIDTSIQLLKEDGSYLTNPPEDYVQLDYIMNRIKGGSSYEANKVLQRTGRFWQKESYDRFVRDEREWCNTVDYILNNPVKAKLVSDWQDWEYSYYKYL